MTETQRRSPYQGLIPYDEEDAPFFFGRDKDTRLIIANLFAAPLTLLYGASGVGKSSVLRAGVVHRLRPRDDLLVVVFNTWQGDPVSGLKATVAEAAAGVGGASISPSDSASLADYLGACAAQLNRRLMVILDQFEEYFLYHPQDDAFAVEFPQAVTGVDGPGSFLISIREDSLAKLDRFEGRIPTLFDNYLRLEHLDRGAAAEAIVKPVEQYNRLLAEPGSEFSVEPGLVEAVIEQVKTGQVLIGQAGRGKVAGPEWGEARVETPYLQLVMTRLWDEEMQAGSRVLQLETLNRLGGAERIVRTHLDTAMNTLPPDEQDVAARVFRYLVTPSGTKIALGTDTLAEWAELPQTQLTCVLDKLSSAAIRILRPVPPPPDQPAALRHEIFHDVLAPAVLNRWRQYAEKQVREQARREEQLKQEQARREERERRARLRFRFVISIGTIMLLLFGAWTLIAFQQGLHVVGEWVDLNGPPGGTIIPLAADPRAADVVYAAISGRDAGLYKTVDGGQTWKAINKGLIGVPITVLKIDPANPHLLYLGTQGGGIFKSTDAGESWNPINSGLTNLNIRSIIIDPRESDTLYAGANGVGGGIFRTTNGGQRWTRYGSGMDSESVNWLISDPTDSQTLFVLTDFGVFKTTDAGWTYRIADQEFPGQVIHWLWIGEKPRKTYYAIARGGKIFRKSEGDEEWFPLRLEAANDIALLLFGDTSDSNIVYASVRNAQGGYSFLISPDGGNTWEHLDNGLTKSPILWFVTDSQIKNNFYLGTSSGLFKSINNGKSWEPLAVGLARASVRAIAIDPNDPSKLWVGIYGGVYRSSDRGIHWTAVNNGLQSADIRSLIVNPGNPQDLFVGVYRPGIAESVFRSQNGGESWMASAEGITDDDTRVLLVRGTNPGVLYAGTFGSGVFKSVDGLHWTSVNNGLSRLDVVGLAGDPISPETIFAATGGGVYRTINGGKTWEQINEGLEDLDVQAIAADQVKQGLLYAATRKCGIYVSHDNGSHWVEATRGLTRLNVVALAVDPQKAGTVYAGTDTGGVFRSTDGGRNWVSISRGMTSANILSLAIPNTGPLVLYAGTLDAGLLRFSSRYLWETANSALPDTSNMKP